ncbi:MAG: glycosyltransferase [Oscillospiraceae bacterium]
MHILILSCNTGGGHNSAASAVVESMCSRGHTGERVDFLSLAGEKVSELVSGAYVGVVKKMPAVFGVTYGVGRAVSSAEHALGVRSPVYLACERVIPALERYLDEHPCDAIVAPHTFPALALTEMKRRGIPLPLTVAVATDYTCTPFFEEGDCDYTMIPSELCMDEFVRRGFPREKLVPLGIPVSEGFQHRVGKEESCRLLGLEPEFRWVLLMGGSMGAGHIAQLTGCLLHLTPEDIHLAVICGSNEKLQREMTRRFGKKTRVKVVGLTDQVARYMEACDLLYTKPGGITSTEGAVMGVPMVHMKPIPGCESRNRQLFTEHGMSVSARGVLAQAVEGRRLLRDPERCAQMVQAQRRQIMAGSADRVAAFLEGHVGKGQP